MDSLHSSPRSTAAGDRAMFTTSVESPLGPLRLVTSAGALVGLYLVDETGAAPCYRGAPPGAVECPSNPLLVDVTRQLREYFAGGRRIFQVPLHLDGTPFQLRVWRALLAIPFSATQSYSDIALAIGQPTARRAVGAANGKNPISIIVPCHRVIGSDGDLVGYGGGLTRKAWLLAHEARADHCAGVPMSG